MTEQTTDNEPQNQGAEPNAFWWLDINNKPEQQEHDQIIEEKLES